MSFTCYNNNNNDAYGDETVNREQRKSKLVTLTGSNDEQDRLVNSKRNLHFCNGPYDLRPSSSSDINYGRRRLRTVYTEFVYTGHCRKSIADVLRF